MNRFEMEEMIMSCWATKEDIELVSERFLDENESSKDKITNALVGIAELHDMKCRKLFEIFEIMISNGEISSENPQFDWGETPQFDQGSEPDPKTTTKKLKKTSKKK